MSVLGFLLTSSRFILNLICFHTLTDHRVHLLQNIVLAQDLLEAVVEGPEGDSIYEIYVEDEEMLDNPDAESGKTTHKENVRYQDQNQSQSQNQNRNQKQNQNQKQSQTQTQRQRRGQAVGDLNRTGNGNGTGTGDRDAEEMGDVDMDVYAAMDEEDEFEILS